MEALVIIDSESTDEYSHGVMKSVVQVAVSTTLLAVLRHFDEKKKKQSSQLVVMRLEESNDVSDFVDKYPKAFFVRGLERSHTLNFQPSRTIDSVYVETAGKEGIEADEFSLVFGGKRLETDGGGVLSDYGITTGSTVHLAAYLFGGGKRGRAGGDGTDDTEVLLQMRADANDIPDVRAAFACGALPHKDAMLVWIRGLGNQDLKDVRDGLSSVARTGNASYLASLMVDGLNEQKGLDAQAKRIKFASGYLRACMTKSIKNSTMSHQQLISTMSEVIGSRNMEA